MPLADVPERSTARDSTSCASSADDEPAKANADSVRRPDGLASLTIQIFVTDAERCSRPGCGALLKATKSFRRIEIPPPRGSKITTPTWIRTYEWKSGCPSGHGLKLDSCASSHGDVG